MRPRFLFSWLNAQTAVIGDEQAALTMAVVMEAGMKRKGQDVDHRQIDAMKASITGNFEKQQYAFVTSALMLDDGIIDPRETRNVLGFALSICRDGDAHTPQPVLSAWRDPDPARHDRIRAKRRQNAASGNIRRAAAEKLSMSLRAAGPR